MNFSTVSELTVSEGRVNRILDASGTEIWKSVRLSGPPTAVLYDDGTMIFQSTNIVDESIGTVVSKYTGWDTKTYATYTLVPWHNHRKSITTVSFKGNVAPISTAYWFRYCTILTDINFDGLDTSNVTTMESMFDNCVSLTSLDLTGLDTSKVTNMRRTFAVCEALTSMTLDYLDTSNVTDMHGMFRNCEVLNWIDLQSFDTSNVTDMGYMFYCCNALSYLDISSFNFGNVSESDNMFRNCDSDLDIFVADSDAADFVMSTTDFPSTATIYVPDEDGGYNPI